MTNKIIIIGSNNYNELGLVRSFGVNGIRPYGIIIGKEQDRKRNFLLKSKYWADTWLVETGEEAISFLLNKFREEKVKPVVITPVDTIMQKMDLMYDELSKYFIFQSMNQKEGRLARLASKKQQSEFANYLGYQMLESEVIQLPFDAEYPKKYPVILKPVAGGEGHKDDITVCYQEEEYKKAIGFFEKNGYDRILCQEYLKDRKEYVVVGALSPKNAFSSYTVIENIRQWPTTYGVGCFSRYITNKGILNYVDNLFKKLQREGYDGPIDIELFEDESGEIYINEFNWRSSGRNFIALDTGVYSNVWWYMLKNDQCIDGKSFVNYREGYTMNEVNDFRNVISKQMKLKDWLKDRKKTSSYALWYKSDIRPVFYPYGWLLKKIMTKQK